MIYGKKEITFPEYVYDYHVSRKNIDPDIKRTSNEGYFIRCVIRNTYLFGKKPRGSGKLSKEEIKDKLSNFRTLDKEFQEDIVAILKWSLFKAYRNEDRIRLIDFIVKESQHPEFDLKKPLEKHIEESLQSLTPISKNLKSYNEKYKEQRIKRTNRILDYLDPKDFKKSSIGRATSRFTETIKLLHEFSLHFPGMINANEVQIFCDHLISINKIMQKFGSENNRELNNKLVNAFYYLMDLAVLKHEGLSATRSKERVVEISEWLNLNPVDTASIPRNLKKGKDFIRETKGLKLKELVLQLTR